MLIKKKIIIVKTRHFGQKTQQTWYFGKITAFDKNRGFRDFRVSVIFYCL